MDAVAQVGRMLKEAAERTRDQGGLACAKFVCFANAVEDNPFMAGAFHGVGEAETIINVGVSGPGVVNHALRHAPANQPLVMAETIKSLLQTLTRRRVGWSRAAAVGHSFRHHRSFPGADSGTG
jgi:uncharacterized protein (UPF0210 family)